MRVSAMIPELRFRQIHVDFHTSEHLESIGAGFDSAEFAESLVNAKVNSITCFARCHHGWLHVDSKKFPERKHRHLQKELLRQQIEACHRCGIRVPIYVTGQWDHYTATHHPEWVCLEAGGTLRGTPSFRAGFLSTPVREFALPRVPEAPHRAVR